MVEIERKFIVPKNVYLEYEISDVLIIEQFYTRIEPDELRYRRYHSNERVWHDMTIKSNGTAIRNEVKKPISPSVFENALHDRIGELIVKIRTELFIATDDIFSVDLYIQPETSKFIAEIEFEREDEMLAFVPPANWIEITEDKNYKNKNIAMKGFPIKDHELLDEQ